MKNYFYFFLAMALPVLVFSQDQNSPIYTAPDQPNNIRYYLNKEAAAISDRSLDTIHDLTGWQEVRNKKKDELAEMLGLDGYPVFERRSAPYIKRVDTIRQDGFDIVKLYYESMDDLFVPANLYIPHNLDQAAPAILYVCGHSHTQKHHYQAHARNLAEQGFVCLIIETIQRGEVKGEHLGTYEKGWFQWYSRGYNPAGVEVWNGIRGIDLLESLAEVDPKRIGVTGISGGGSQSWYLPALDERIQAAAAVAGAGSLEGQVCQKTLDDHCDCMMPINTFLWDFSDIGALIAPRPFVVAQTRHDGYYSIESVRDLYQRTSKIYELYGRGEHISMMEAPGGHSYGENEEMRPRILSFFRKHLQNDESGATELENIDVSKVLSNTDLSVYSGKPPENDRTKLIQESFVSKADVPVIKNRADLNAYRQRIAKELEAKTFRAFPDEPPSLEGKLEFSTRNFSKFGREIYSFVSEKGWRLKLDVRRTARPSEESAPVLLILNNPNEAKWASHHLARGRNNDYNIAYFEARGIGETGWAENQKWHIRRASAWTGRTIASMRVYDVLRSLQYLRTLEGVDPANIHLAARGEMAVVAAYAALLDGTIKSLTLENPPATQDVESDPEGRGPALEMLNCLRITDLPQVVACQFPGNLTLLGQIPESYQWVEEIYNDLGNMSIRSQ